MVNDLIVIGGGAAGLCAAVYFKKQNQNSSVRIIEALTRVGKKLALTGNGRCNITNANIDLSRYHGENTDFCEYALNRYDRFFTEDFFNSIGVDFVFEDDKGYPASLQAASVVDCLRFAVEEQGILLNLETPVTNIQISGGNYKVVCNQLSFYAKNLIIATGLLSGGERLGCDGKMLEILKKAEFKVLKPTPAIVQVKTETEITKQLKGIKVNAKATLRSENFENSDFGEVLFCDYGLSGPPILQISREVSRLNSSQIVLDLFPNISFSDLYNTLLKRKNDLLNRKLEEFFTGMLQKRVGQVVLKIVGCKLNDFAESLTDKKIKEITSLLKSWKFECTGTTGFLNSQVSAGGLDTKEFNPETMESKSSRSLYCIGEILDIDGDCGGFNLQWAWSSAFCAADAIGNKND